LVRKKFCQIGLFDFTSFFGLDFFKLSSPPLCICLFTSTTKNQLFVYIFQVYDSDLRSRSPDQPPREVQRRKQRQVEERRVVYVGRITEGITRADLRKRFETFGPIEEISVHFRDRGDNYGFVTFRNKADAFAAIEQGNDDTSYPKVDLCFGGRRTFCKEKYSDLDSRSLHTGAKTHNVGSTSRHTALDEDGGGDVEENVNVSTNDFDTLLKKARAGIRNTK